jgi:hypothetical protein
MVDYGINLLSMRLYWMLSLMLPLASCSERKIQDINFTWPLLDGK